MVRRSAVASRTVLIANRGVIKNGVGKVAGIRMTSGTGTRPVVGWRRMAARAILRADGVVVENGVGEVVRVAVTGRTILPANGGVIEIDIAEVARVLMASRASTRIVIGRRTVASRAILPTNR